MPVSIPIKEAELLAKAYGYEQVIIYTRDCKSGAEHMTTYGVTKEHCTAAAKIGDFLKYTIMGWNKEQKK